MSEHLFETAFEDVLREEMARQPVWVVGLFIADLGRPLEWMPTLGYIIGKTCDGCLYVSITPLTTWVKKPSETYGTRRIAQGVADRKNNRYAAAIHMGMMSTNDLFGQDDE